MLWCINIVVVFLLSALFAGVLIPKILLISFRKNILDMPNERKVHTCAVPRLGGVAFIPVIIICLALMWGLNLILGVDDMSIILWGGARTAAFSFSALFLIYVVGMADDFIGVQYRAKFFAQILCAIMLICGGLYINDFHGFLGINEVSNWIAWPFTVLLAVFIMNAINLIDGIDGLASGLSSVAVTTYGIIFYLNGDFISAMISAATLGVLVPFSYYNIFGNPEKQKKIFMGDTGALSIGLILCVVSFKMVNAAPPFDMPDINMLIVAMSPLIIPSFDVIRVYFTRIRNGRNPFLPDKNHIHHKLLALGFNQRTAMALIVGSSILLTVVNIFMSVYLNINLILLIDVVVWITIMTIIHRKIVRIEQSQK